MGTALAMDKTLEEGKEFTSTQPSHEFSAHYPFLNFNIWEMTRIVTDRYHLYFYGTNNKNFIGVRGYEERLDGKFPIYGKIYLPT